MLIIEQVKALRAACSFPCDSSYTLPTSLVEQINIDCHFNTWPHTTKTEATDIKHRVRDLCLFRYFTGA